MVYKFIVYMLSNLFIVLALLYLPLVQCHLITL
uniref:Uncharacterized protein n=1 Tax=Anguilla anguilla TaxID=7936 RepID=A0A0E9Y1S4_ANGAN